MLFYTIYSMYGMYGIILYLGQGKASLRRDPLSLASLILSMSPRYPSRTMDNQMHLQPLRHMYVLAVEERCLTTVDVNKDQSVSLPVEVPCLTLHSIV